jgi:branched-chain amino acid aminotransferase
MTIVSRLSTRNVHVYALTNNHLQLIDLGGPALDAVSLQLPEGVYTTLRTYDQNRLLALRAHLQRLQDSYVALGREHPLDLAAIRSAVRTVLALEGLNAARLRITTPFESDQVFISIEPFETYPVEDYTQGVRCATGRVTREVPKAKQTNFIAPSCAVKERLNTGIHELLLVDTESRILEGTTSNFFAVWNGVLRTAGQGVLEGVTRGIVLAQAQAMVPVVYEAIKLSDLSQTTEAFITSSSREVMPVIQIDEHVIGAGRPGSITQGLAARYREFLKQSAEVP